MKALDTNILVRFLIQDDELQSKVVFDLFSNAERQKESFFISILVVVETIWVLESVYQVKRNDLIKAISELMLMPVLDFEKQTVVRDFIISSENSTFDLSDILIAQSAKNSGCAATLTFDKKASKFKLFEYLGKWRTSAGAEVDLVLEGEFGLIPVEIKYTQKVTLRSLAGIRGVMKDFNCSYGIIISNAERITLIDKNLINIPFGYFWFKLKNQNLPSHADQKISISYIFVII